jgi:Holliday junction DNA helicase RuvB
VKVPLQPFTLIGATTRAGLLTSPLRARFGIVHRLDFYEEADLVDIVTRSARILGVEIDPRRRARLRAVPRHAAHRQSSVRRVRDFAQVRADGRSPRRCVHDALELLEVDSTVSMRRSPTAADHHRQVQRRPVG